MIYSITCDKESFQTVKLKPGFNVVLADRTKESTKKDSRNGLGKSTLIEIIHFCLGATFRKGRGLGSGELSGWTFSIDVDLAGTRVKVSRNTAHSSKIFVQGDFSQWPVQPKYDKKSGLPVFGIKTWNAMLGQLVFGLDAEIQSLKYAPTFRSLISYMIRRGRDAYSTPFEHYRKQLEWDKQVNNTYLLGLSWEYAREYQVLKDKEKAIKALKGASKTGLVKQFVGTVGDLEAQQVRLEEQVDKEAKGLKSFRVIDQYREIEQTVDRLTQEIHEEQNMNVRERRLLSRYEDSLVEELSPGGEEIETLYKRIGIELPAVVLKRLEDVRLFHQQVIQNRRQFLSSEVNRLKRSMASRTANIEAMVEERAGLMDILEIGGALEEYTHLQKAHNQKLAALSEVTNRIATLKQLERSASELKIEKEHLTQQARADFDERKSIRAKAIQLFNSNSEALYDVPGKLVINISPTGYKFDVVIERSGSQGIESMKVFCYDLMIAQIWATWQPPPGFLIHDSTIFDGVDERQVALALELAARESASKGFQYVCALNSDTLPYDELSASFDIERYVRLRLTDTHVEGSLMGIRFGQLTSR